MELGSNEAIKQAVAGGLGLSLLSLHALVPEARRGELAVLDVRHLPREVRHARPSTVSLASSWAKASSSDGFWRSGSISWKASIRSIRCSSWSKRLMESYRVTRSITVRVA